MRQASNLKLLLWKSKFVPVEENFQVNSCGKNCVCCPYLLESSSYLFKKVNKAFFLKIILIARTETFFMSLVVKVAK